MTPGICSLDQNPFEFIPWPEASEVVLVLDPCAIPELGRQLFEWSDHFYKVDCLYVNTPWEPIQDVSPWAIWLTGQDDPFLQHFIRHEAGNEAGYLLYTTLSHPELGDWLRQRIQVERAPEAVELMRIAHPALALEVIGNELICTMPKDAVQQMLLPDKTTGQWHGTAVSSQGLPPNTKDEIYLSPELHEAFVRFNRRRVNLIIWDKLSAPDRKHIGGPELRTAWPELTRLTHEAAKRGFHGTRSQLQYVLRYCHKDVPASASVTCLNSEAVIQG